MTEPAERVSWAAPAFVFAAAVVVYLNTLPGAFQYDDLPFIVNNPAVHTLAQPWKFLMDRAAFSEGGSFTIFRPLSGWLFSLTWALAPNTPAAFHAVNLLAHACAAVCVWRLAVAVGLGPARGALWAGLLFAVHPVNTEAVTWIAGLGNPLFTIGVTCACVAWLRWRGAGTPSLGIAGVFGWYVFGLLGKEHALALPGLVLGLEWALRRDDLRPRGQRAAAFAGLVVLSGCYLAWRAHVLGQTGQTGYWGGSLAAAMLSMVNGVRIYLRLLIAPLDLHPEYVVPIPGSVLAPDVVGSAVLLFVVVGAAVALRRREPRAALGLAWIFLALAPVSNVVPMKTLINERLLYLSVAGFGLAVGVLWEWAPRRVWRGLLAGQLVLYAILTVARNRDWQTPERLWAAAVASEPRGYISHYNLGRVRMQHGDLDTAAREIQEAIRLRGTYPLARGALGNVHMQRGEFADAARSYRLGLREDAGNANLRRNLVIALVQQGEAARAAGRIAEARSAYRDALALEPGHPAAAAGLAALGEERAQ